GIVNGCVIQQWVDNIATTEIGVLGNGGCLQMSVIQDHSLLLTVCGLGGFDLTKVDPRIKAALDEIYTEYPDPPASPPALENEDGDDGSDTCPLCNKKLFLRMRCEACGHAFCAECLWESLCSLSPEAAPGCP